MNRRSSVSRRMLAELAPAVSFGPGPLGLLAVELEPGKLTLSAAEELLSGT